MTDTSIISTLQSRLIVRWVSGVLFSLIVVSCGHTGKKINFLETAPIKPKDSVTQAYYDGRYFSPYIIRLGKSPAKEFIKIDTTFIKTKLITKTNREEYYKQTMQKIAPEELRVYRLIWQLPEMKALQTADGGNGTIVIRIKDKPASDRHYYEVEVMKNEIEQLTPVKDLTFFRIYLHPQKIEIASQSEYFVSLDKWRKVIR